MAVPVRADVEDVRVVLEDVLHAVAVVDVPVEHHHAADAEAAAGGGDGDADVVEQAEAHRVVVLAVVAWRAHDRQRVAELALADARGELDERAGREQSRVARGGGAEVRVAV